MRAIFKREMRAYFASPVGYVVVAALLALSSSDIAVFDAARDPWEAVTLCQPPLPECGADYTVALALAMSEAP